MEADISHVRRNILLLLVTIVVVFAVLLLAATPVISNLSPEGTRQERVNYLIGLPMVVSILGGLLHIYLRPIARLATLIKDEEKLPPDLAQRARTLAFALPVWTLYIPPAVTLAIGTAIDLAGTYLVEGYSFSQNFPSTLLATKPATRAASRRSPAVTTPRWRRTSLRVR